MQRGLYRLTIYSTWLFTFGTFNFFLSGLGRNRQSACFMLESRPVQQSRQQAKLPYCPTIYSVVKTERVKLLGSLTYFLSFSKTICTIGLMNETSGLTRRQIEINLFSQQLSTITRCHLYLVARLLDGSYYICRVRRLGQNYKP